jgi:hypothetical protein
VLAVLLGLALALGSAGSVTPADVDAEFEPLFEEARAALCMPRAVIARVLRNARSDEEIDARAALLAEVLEISLANEVELSDEARERLSEIECGDRDE